MSLEQMNKNDLVRDLRAANQSNKELVTEVEELKKQVSQLTEEKDNIGNTDQEVVELPYLAVSQFREAAGKGGFALRIRYDLQGNAKIVSKSYFNEHYKTNWEAVKILETEVEKQMEVFTGEQSEN